jgi:WD40 repeat protein
MVSEDVTEAVAGELPSDIGPVARSATGRHGDAASEQDAVTRTRYEAFISYRHGADDSVAAAIERGLERLARPWNRLRAMSVFRDLSDLAAASDLSGAITRGLDESRFLILLASPESAASPWVDKEVAYWCDRGRGVTQVIVAVTGGEFEWDESTGALTTSTDAVSSAVRSRFTTEPLYVDLRWARTAGELSLRDSRFRAAIVRIGATIRGIAPADLESDDVRLHRRARRLARVAVATVLVLALVASLAAVVAVRNAHEAEANAREAVANAREAERRARDALGRQLGLTALDLPASEVDQAFLLSLVAADLDTGDDADDFQASRTLIGRYFGLDKLLYAPPETTSLNNIAISDDGVIAATTGHDLLTWPAVGARDAPSVTDLRDHVGDEISAISFLDGGRLLVEGSNSTGVVRIDGDGSDFEPFPDVVDIDTDARLLAERTTSGAITLTDLDSGSLLARVDAINDVRSDLRYGRLAIASEHEVRVVEGRSAADARGSVASGTVVMAIAAGPTDEVAAVTASADEIVPWSRRGDALHAADAVALPTGVGQPDRLLVAPDGARVLVVGTTGSAMVDVVAGTAVGFHGYTGRVLTDPSGRFAAVGGFAAVGESRLTLWDFDSGLPTFAVPLLIEAMAWSGTCETSCRLVTAGGSLDTWDPFTRRRVQLANQANAQAVATSADGNTVVTAGWGSSVAVWQLLPIIDNSSRTEMAAGDIIARHGSQCPNAGGRDLSAVSPDGALVVTYRPSDGNTTVCRASDGSPVATGSIAELKPLLPDAVAVDNEGNVAIAGRWSNSGDIFVRLLRDGQEFPMEGVHTVWLGSAPVHVTALAYHADTIVGGLRPDDEAARAGVGVWSPDRGPPAIFESGYYEVPAVALLGDDASAVVVAQRDSPGGDVTLQIWETLTPVRRGRALGGLSGDVIALGGDETEVFAADAAGHAYRWALDPNPTRDLVCDIVGRPLSRDEWRTFAGGALRRFSPKEMCPAPTAPPPGSVVSNAG